MWRSHPIFSLCLSLFVSLSFSVCLSAYLCLSFCLILSLSFELPMNKTTFFKSSLLLTVQWQACRRSSVGDHDQTNTAPSVEATYCTVLADTGQEKLLVEMLWSQGSRCHMPTADWGSKAKMQILVLLNHALSAWCPQEWLTQSSYLLDSKYAPSSEVASGTNLGWKGYKSESSIWARANLSSLVAYLTCEVWAPRVRGKKEPPQWRGQYCAYQGLCDSEARRPEVPSFSYPASLYCWSDVLVSSGLPYFTKLLGPHRGHSPFSESLKLTLQMPCSHPSALRVKESLQILTIVFGLLLHLQSWSSY